MSEIVVEQAVFHATGEDGVELRARSPQFSEEWLQSAEMFCRGFGRPPAGSACPPALFAQPLGRHHVAVVQVASAVNGHAGHLRFHVAVLGTDEYGGLGGDPFTVAERCPPNWDAMGEIPLVTWPREPFPSRTVEDVRAVLRRDDGPNLLGGSQVLLDGGRIAFERAKPDGKLLRDLWTLLPTRSRSEMWPATFAFSNALRFHTVVVPPGLRTTSPKEFPHYLTEEEAGDYPEGRYELRLQSAAEAGDQEGLDSLFARRSRTDMWKLGLLILIGMIILPFLVRWLAPPPVHDSSSSSSASSASP
jgi:hypothetical protein